MKLELAYISSNNITAPMPDAKGLEFSPVFSDVGIIKFSYPKSGVNAQYVADGNEFCILLDGVEITDSRFELEESSIDEAAEVGEWEIQGRTMLQQFEFAVVYPPSWPTQTPAETAYVNATPGYIIKDQVTKAQARGGLVGFSTSTLTNSTDSNGAAWAKTVSITYDPGVSLLSLIQNLVEQGAIEVRMNGKSLQVYNPGTLGTDLTVTQPGWILRKGRDTKDSPRKTSRTELGTALLLQGDSGIYVERTDSAAITAYKRREFYATQSGITDTGTLNAYGDALLGLRKQPRVEKTHGLVFAEQGTPKPFTQFNVGDWIYSDTNGSVERLRIKQWTLKNEEDGSLSGSVVLNDLFADTVEKLSKQIDGITGSAVSGTSTGSQDTTVPAAPSAPSFTSAIFNDATGTTWAQITVTWSAITLNSDGSPLNDFAYYVVQYGFGATPATWNTIYTGTDLTCQFSPLKAGTTIAVRVGAYDKSNKFSGWSPLYTDATAADPTPPPVPTTPVAVAYLGSIKAIWDGAFAAAAPKPADFRHVEVHVGLASNFSVDDTTQVGVLTGAGSVSVPALTYGTQYWVKFRSVDLSGNKSADTAADDATPAPATVGDIEPSVLADVSSDPVFVQYFGNGDGTSGWEEYAGQGVLNYQSQAGSTTYTNTFESGTVFNTAASGYTTAQSTALSSAQAHSGTQSMLITWATGAAFSQAPNRGWNKLVPGRTYDVTCWVYVPTGMPHVKLQDLFGGNGAAAHPTLPQTSTTRNAWQQLGMRITPPTNTYAWIAILNAETATAGNTAYVDDWAIADISLDETFWYNDTLAPTVPGVLRLNGPQKAEWTGSNPFPYDPEAVYNFRGRLKVTVPELCNDRDFALGTSANWDNYWGGGSITWVYSGNTGKATSAADAQNAVLRNSGTNSNEVAEGTIIKISGQVRTSYNSGSGPFVECVTSATAGQAVYFGTGVVVGGSLTIDPSPDTATYMDFYVEFTIPAGHICYTVYFRDVLDNGQWVEWDNLSIKELSPTIQIGMIGYQADRTTPIEPDNTTAGKATIHAALDTNAGLTRDGDWYEFDAYISDRSTDVSTGDGKTAKTARSMAALTRYWRPAILFGAASNAVVKSILDIDWFQIDRIKANISIPGAILASAVDADTLIGANVVATETFRFGNDPLSGRVLTSADDLGSAAWMDIPPAAKISTDGTPPAGLRAGDLWLNPIMLDAVPSIITAVGPSTERNIFLGTTYTKVSEFGDMRITIPCDGVLEVDFYCWAGWTTAGTAGTAVTLGHLEMDINTPGYTTYDEGHMDYWYHRNTVSVANNKRDVRVMRTVRFDSVPADGVDISLYVMAYGSTSQAVVQYPRYRIKFTPYANMVRFTMT